MTRTPTEGDRKVRTRILLSWFVVVLPLSWGVWQVAVKSTALFR